MAGITSSEEVPHSGHFALSVWDYLSSYIRLRFKDPAFAVIPSMLAERDITINITHTTSFVLT